MERDDGTFAVGKYVEHFNSHAHVERDSKQTSKISDESISTHTLTWSVTFKVS